MTGGAGTFACRAETHVGACSRVQPSVEAGRPNLRFGGSLTLHNPLSHHESQNHAAPLAVVSLDLNIVKPPGIPKRVKIAPHRCLVVNVAGLALDNRPEDVPRNEARPPELDRFNHIGCVRAAGGWPAWGLPCGLRASGPRRHQTKHAKDPAEADRPLPFTYAPNMSLVLVYRFSSSIIFATSRLGVKRFESPPERSPTSQKYSHLIFNNIPASTARFTGRVCSTPTRRKPFPCPQRLT